jgi:hypothetical protein
MRVPTKQGINHNVYVYSIPLYIKLIEFIDRDYRYRELAGKVTRGQKSDKAKALAIFKWVRANIKTVIPEGWPIYDDHIWYIIIRGYGTQDQASDVFTTLVSYSGVEAGWARVMIPGHEKGLVLSFVRIDGQWRVFDIAAGVYFTRAPEGHALYHTVQGVNEWPSVQGSAPPKERWSFTDKERALASVDEIIAGDYGIWPKTESGQRAVYDDYFRYMKQYLSGITLRPKKQMPFQRIFCELAGIGRGDRQDKE